MKTFRLPVYFFAIAAMLFWGMSFVWTSILLDWYQPVTIIFVRLVISSAFLFALVRIFNNPLRIERKDWLLMFASALLNPFLYFLCENYGVKYSTSTVSAVIIGTIPVFTPLFAFLFFREKLSWLNFLGLFLSFSGVIVMILGKDFSFTVDIHGVYFLFGAVFTAIFYSVLLKKLSKSYSPLAMIAWQNLIGAFLFLPLFMVFEFQHATRFMPGLRLVSSFLFLAILASSLSYVFFAKTVKEIGISRSNIFSYLIPVFTAGFSLLILGEHFSFIKITGMIIVVAGVYISGINRRKG